MTTAVKFLRPSEVAKRFSVHRATIYRWFWEGKLDGIKPPNGPLRIFTGEHPLEAVVDIVVPPDKKFWRPDEIAEVLDLNQCTVYRMIQGGRLQGVRSDSGPWRVSREVLVDFILAGANP